MNYENGRRQSLFLFLNASTIGRYLKIAFHEALHSDACQSYQAVRVVDRQQGSRAELGRHWELLWRRDKRY